MELAVCHQYRIPHSTFLGWSEDDRDKAIWSHVRERETCPGCGTRPDEWDPQQGGHMDAYRAAVHLCLGCRAVEGKRKDQGDHPAAGAHVVLRRSPRVQQQP